MSERKKQNNYIGYGGPKMLAMYPLFFLFFVKIAYMTRKIEVAGISYFALGFAPFFLLFCLNGSMIPDIMRKMIIFQVNRRSVRNALKLYRVIWCFSVLVAAVFGAALFFLSDRISQFLFHTPLISLPLKIFGIVLILIVPQQCMKGYLEGVSGQVPGIVSMFIMLVIDLVTTVLIQNSCMEYGERVAALMRDRRYYYAYAGIGGMIGFAVGSAFSFLFLLLITTLLKQMQKERMKQDEPKNALRAIDILGNYMSNSLQDFLPNCYVALLFLCICVMFGHKNPENMDSIGMLFISLLAGIPILLNSVFQGKFAFRQVHSLIRRGDINGARDRIAVHLKSLLYVTLFASVLLIFSPTSFCALFFDTTTEEMIKTFQGTQIAILVLTIAVMIVCIASAFVKTVGKCLLYLAGIAVFFVMTGVFQNAKAAGVVSFIYAILISSLVIALFGSFLCFKMSHYREDLIRVFVLPCIAAAALLLVCLFVDKLLYKSVGAAVSMLLSLVAGYFCYLLVIIMTHTFDRREWNEVPFNKAAVFVAKKLHMY